MRVTVACVCARAQELGLRGKLELEFDGHALPGIACKLDSPGYKGESLHPLCPLFPTRPCLCLPVAAAALCDGIEKATGSCVPFSIGGSLPLVDQLQNAGFGEQLCCRVSPRRRLLLCWAWVTMPLCDACVLVPPPSPVADVQVVGFGLMSTYHANNEYCTLSGMKNGFAALSHVIGALNSSA